MTPPDFDLDVIGTGLPFAAALPDLHRALRGGVAVVQAPPGTGKTTLVPPTVANAVPGRVILTQPRRVAVRAAARRLAQLTGTQVGGLVGYTVRGDRAVGAGTRIEVVTPGVLVRRLLGDPELAGVGAVVLDEVHERSVDTDLLVGMLAEARELRPDLGLVAMSATVDAALFARLLGAPGEEPAPIVDCPSALHPIDLTWLPYDAPSHDSRGATLGFLAHVARAATAAHSTALADDPSADALVFLPGAREVETVAVQMQRLMPDREVLQLHGRVAAREQDRATSGRSAGEPPRVVVATDIAESSLTIPGVRLVIDAGLAREPRRDLARGMSGLVTLRESRASADQRAGRAARLGPGRVVRCFSEAVYARMSDHRTPEMATADLTDAVLLLACWGSPGGRGLQLPTPLPEPAVADAESALRSLGAVDGPGRATDVGRLLATVPADPRLARALLDGAAVRGADATAEVVAMLAGDHRAEGADLVTLLAALRSGSAPGHREWRREATRLGRIARRHTSLADAPPGQRDGASVGEIVALAFPERIARRVGDTWLLARGTRAALPPGSPLTDREWLAVSDAARVEGGVGQGTGAVIRAAAPLTRELAERAGSHLLRQETRAAFDGSRIAARRVRALGAIELSSTPVPIEGEQGYAALRAALAADGLGVLRWGPGADAARRRMAFLHHHAGAPWPDVSDEALAGRLEDWLGPEIDRIAHGARVDQLALTDAVRRLLPWPEATRLDELAPERLPVPSGSSPRVRYPAVDEPDARPVVEVKLQECFGLAETPRLAGGRAPVLFRLLSPAGRPLAITDDLASFWSGPYAQVRSEMRGRYPKHPWPEDPWTAVATRHTSKRAGLH
ncbi:MAG: ATP-dependent helicase HrpB [Micrococcales bacterium]|nr:ATP-dependent helicase HrpB [Micrococcales bacterium]